MLRPLALTACLIALCAHSTAFAGKPKSCSGNNRRAANPNGSVLPGSTIAAVTAPIAPPPTPGLDGRPARDKAASRTAVPAISGTVSAPTPGAGAKPKKVSALTPGVFTSCREARG